MISEPVVTHFSFSLDVVSAERNVHLPRIVLCMYGLSLRRVPICLVTWPIRVKIFGHGPSDFGLTHTTVLVCVHPGGHGESKDLELLCEDLSNHNFVPKVVDFLQEE